MTDASPVLVPQMNANDDHAVIVAWHVQSGERVSAGQLVATLETTKAAFDVNAPCDGFIAYTEAEKSIVSVGAPVAWIADAPRAVPSAAEDTDTGAAPLNAVVGGRFTRKALRRMRELGLESGDFAGSSRVDVAEVERTATGRFRTLQIGAADDTSKPADCDPIEESPSKLLEALRLAKTYSEVVPSLVTVSVCSARLQARLRDLAAAMGPISFLELVMREAALLLRDYPDLNGYFSDGRGWRYREVSVGFAVNAGLGLKVPVIHRTAELSQIEVARAVRDLTLRYLRGELTVTDVQGGTFTLTDLSEQDVTNFIPVINERQSAVLGLCAERPGTGHRDIVLCFDHRMSDGARGGRFLSALRERVEGMEPRN